MPWKVPPKQRSLPCNGELIRYYRKQAGWTQDDLSQRAGYTVRLIRKVESGRPVHADTIEDIADSMASIGLPVTPEDLVSDPLTMARRFCRLLSSDEGNAAKATVPLLANEMSMTVAGDPELYPFAGSFAGTCGYDEFCRNFFRVMFCPDKSFWRPKIVAHGNEALSWGVQQMQLPDAEEPIFSMLVFRFVFDRGKIIRIEDDYNVEASYAYFRKHAAHLFDSGQDHTGPKSS